MGGAWREKLGPRQALPLAGTAIVLLGVVGLPMLERKAPGRDPSAEAQSAYELVRARLGAFEQEAEAADPEQASAGEGRGSNDSMEPDEVLSRDLFSYERFLPRTDAAPRPVRPAAVMPPSAGSSVSPSPAADSEAGRSEARASEAAPANAATSGMPALSGILIDGRSRRAVISGKVVAVGDEVDGYRVLAIESARVRLGRGQETITLEVK